MEEKQIADFVSRLYNDEELRAELKKDADSVIMREGFSPRVARVVRLIVPHLSMDKPLGGPSFYWTTP